MLFLDKTYSMSKKIITLFISLFCLLSFAQKNPEGKMTVFEITYKNGKAAEKQKLMQKATLLYEPSEDYYYIDGSREDGLKTGLPLFYQKTVKGKKYYSHNDIAFTKTNETAKLIIFKSEQLKNSDDQEYIEIKLELTK
ncbi:hypothetical protein SAMN04488018_10859 [Myroides marinus]|uniref:Uncharacterized protein n=2 Tax=Myroides marinus TaxID=703342 RepID=A0A1H6UYI0_9FLAO|nr:hypothetical protein SAMN04488018_10859 [Myroides marinus]